MATHDESHSDRLDALERRVAALEHLLITREAVDEEIRSLEERLAQLRERTEG